VTLVLTLLFIPILGLAQANLVASSPREPTDVYIRRLAGLPASSAEGEIRIVDVGHLPLSTMLSIVANKGLAGWHVSYTCASSPHCTENADHLVLSYDLGDGRSRRVDAILEELQAGGDPGGTKPSPTLICGNLTVAINYRGFQRDYTRSCSWGNKLGELEALLQPHSSSP
jgi:hypothetical protein